MAFAKKRKQTQEWLTDPDRLAEGFLLGYLFDPEPETEKYKEGHYTLAFWQDGFYEWSEGAYTAILNSDMRLRVKRYLHDLNDGSDDGQVRVSTSLINNIILCIAGMGGVHLEGRKLNSWDDGRERLYQTVAFSNGLLTYGYKSDKPMLVKQTPQYFSLIKLPYEYDPDALCPAWDEFIYDVMSQDLELVELLQQWAGYLLTNDLRQQKLLLITGSGSNGKTVFFEILERMIGRVNTTHIPLSQFGNPFALASTIGKLANISSESGSAINAFGETTLKAYTSGDSMNFQRKYLDSIDAIPTAKVMIATNHLPKFNDKSFGIWRRLLFVDFEKVYTESQQKKNLANELADELPGIFNWAMVGLESLKESGKFTQPEKCRKALDNYKLSLNPAAAFLTENYEYSPEFDGTPCAQIYQQYVQWCEANGYKSLNAANFGREVNSMFNVVKTRPMYDGKRTNLYAGIEVKEDAEIGQMDY